MSKWKSLIKALDKTPGEFWLGNMGKALTKAQEFSQNSGMEGVYKEKLEKPLMDYWNRTKLASQTFNSALGSDKPIDENLISKVQESGMLNKEGEMGGRELWNNIRNTGNVMLKTAGLASPQVAGLSALTGATVGPVFRAGANVLEGKPITEGVAEAVLPGMMSGFANSGTTRLTSSLVKGLSSSVPILQKYTEESLKAGLPVGNETLNQAFGKWADVAGRRLFRGAVIETLVETPIWASLTQGEQEKYTDALVREGIENLKMNIFYAGWGSLKDASSLQPIIKASVEPVVRKIVVDNFDGSLKSQAGYIRMPTIGEEDSFDSNDSIKAQVNFLIDTGNMLLNKGLSEKEVDTEMLKMLKNGQLDRISPEGKINPSALAKFYDLRAEEVAKMMGNYNYPKIIPEENKKIPFEPTKKEGIKPEAQLIGKEHDINLKNKLTVRNVQGKKVEIPKGEAFTPYIRADGKVVLQDGMQVTVQKSVYDNVLQNSKVEGKVEPFGQDTLNKTITTKLMTQSVPVMTQEEGEELYKRAYQGVKEGTVSNRGNEGYLLNVEKQAGKNPQYRDYSLASEDSRVRELLINKPIDYRELIFQEDRENEIKQILDGQGYKTVEKDGKIYRAGTSTGEPLGRGFDSYRALARDMWVDVKKWKNDRHFEEYDDTVSHARLTRFNYKPEGGREEKVLVVDEAQGDWNNEALLKGDQITRKPNWKQVLTELPKEYTVKLEKSADGDDVLRLYKTEGKAKDLERAITIRYKDDFDTVDKKQAIAKGKKQFLDYVNKNQPGTPYSELAPKWLEIATEGALREAVLNGDDRVVVTLPEQQENRWSLANWAEKIEWSKVPKKDTELAGEKYAKVTKGVIVSTKEGKKIEFLIGDDGIVYQTHTSGRSLGGEFNGHHISQVLDNEGYANKIAGKNKGEIDLKDKEQRIAPSWPTKVYGEKIIQAYKKLTKQEPEYIDLGISDLDKSKIYPEFYSKATLKDITKADEVKVFDTVLSNRNGGEYIILNIDKDKGKLQVIDGYDARALNYTDIITKAKNEKNAVKEILEQAKKNEIRVRSFNLPDGLKTVKMPSFKITDEVKRMVLGKGQTLEKKPSGISPFEFIIEEEPEVKGEQLQSKVNSGLLEKLIEAGKKKGVSQGNLDEFIMKSKSMNSDKIGSAFAALIRASQKN